MKRAHYAIAQNKVTPIPVALAEQPPSGLKSPVEKITTSIGIPAAIGSTMTAAAYLTGVVFHQTYLTAFKINYGLFPKSSSEYFLFAYQAILELLPAGLVVAGKDFRIPMMVFLGFFTYIAMNMVGRALDANERVRRIRDKAQKSRRLGIVGGLLLFPTMGLALLFYGLLFVIILLALPALIGETGSTRIAKTDKAKFEKGCKPTENSKAFCTRILEGDKLVAQGFVIEISSQYVAIVENGTARVLPIKERAFASYEE